MTVNKPLASPTVLGENSYRAVNWLGMHSHAGAWERNKHYLLPCAFSLEPFAYSIITTLYLKHVIYGTNAFFPYQLQPPVLQHYLLFSQNDIPDKIFQSALLLLSMVN